VRLCTEPQQQSPWAVSSCAHLLSGVSCAAGTPKAGKKDGHRITERFELGGTSEDHLDQHPVMGRDPCHQTRLLKAPSNLALNPAREGAATASLGNLGQGHNILMVKNFFHVSNLNLPSFSLKPSPLVLSLHALVTSPSPAIL